MKCEADSMLPVFFPPDASLVVKLVVLIGVIVANFALAPVLIRLFWKNRKEIQACDEFIEFRVPKE
jgi:hypothetical protein